MTFIKRFSATFAGLAVIAFSAFAQGGQQQQILSPSDISDDELRQFADASLSVQSIQEKAQAEIREMVKEEDIEFRRFQQIMMSRQNSQAAGQMNVTDEEENIIQNMTPQLDTLQQNAQQEMAAALQEEGLSIQRFQMIARSLRSNQELARKVQQYRQEAIQKDNSGEEDDGGGTN